MAKTLCEIFGRKDEPKWKKQARITRRRNHRNGVPGRLRQRVAELLSEHFGRYVDPTHVRPATGHYRTSPYADVYRWEFSEFHASDMTRCHCAGCWITMTEFVKDAKKHGIIIEDGEIWPNYPRKGNQCPTGKTKVRK